MIREELDNLAHGDHRDVVLLPVRSGVSWHPSIWSVRGSCKQSGLLMWPAQRLRGGQGVRASPRLDAGQLKEDKATFYARASYGVRYREIDKTRAF